MNDQVDQTPVETDIPEFLKRKPEAPKEGEGKKQEG